MGSNDGGFSMLHTESVWTVDTWTHAARGRGRRLPTGLLLLFPRGVCALSFQPGKASRRPHNGRCVLKARSLTAPSVFAFPCLVRSRAACWRRATGVQTQAWTAEPAVWSVSARSGRRAGRLCPRSGWGGWAGATTAWYTPAPPTAAGQQIVRCKS